MLNINIRKNIRLACLLLSTTLLASGCGVFSFGSSNPLGDTQHQSAGNSQKNTFSIEEQYATALLDQGIELPTSRTRIYVNQSGYSSDRDKKVLFLGDEHGDTFRVVRKFDRQVVYTGSISTAVSDKLSSVSLGVGDFSQITETGIYYIESDIIGQSYPFIVAPDAYENLFLGLLENVSDARLEESADGVCNVSFGMNILMYSLQCNGTLYEEAYTHLSENGSDEDMVTELLQMAQWLLSIQSDNGSLYDDYEATAAFCGVMTMSLDTFGIYQSSVAKEYRSAAVKAWDWLETQSCDTDVRKAARFYAAAQLFTSVGSREYHDIVLEFFDNELESYSNNRFVFYGIIAYMSCDKNIDRDLCTRIMIKLVDETEKVSNDAKEDTFFGTGVRSVEGSLSNIRLIGFTNYITPNKEYTAIIENTIKYMGGLNEKGECYISASGAWQGFDETAGRSLEWNGIVLFVYSDMLKNLSDMENNNSNEIQ